MQARAAGVWTVRKRRCSCLRQRFFLQFICRATDGPLLNTYGQQPILNNEAVFDLVSRGSHERRLHALPE